MKLGKNINFIQYVKAPSSLFTGARSFWISLGSIFGVMIIVSALLVFPLSKKCATAYKGLDDLSSMLEKYALKKDIYNGKWIASKKLEAELCDEETGKCKSFLKGRDDLLESVFVKEEPGKGIVKIEDEALWKLEYSKRVSSVLAKLAENNIAASAEAFPFSNWGLNIPAWKDILPTQKRFWILDAISRIALRKSGITHIKKVTFRESPHAYNPAYTKIYAPIPVTIQVEVRADYINFLLQEILRSDVPFVIENTIIMNTDKFFNPDEATQGAASRLPCPIIEVTLDMYAIDYKA
ncbi:MAG: hypothetical protein HZB37_10250 [Planctomycetes bacterium]|nr:hypothetical protein [Planctomycetota bacterium]